VQLPHGELLVFVQGGEQFGRTALLRAVAHHGDPRLEGGKRRRIGGVGVAVMRHEIDIDPSDAVVRTDERSQRRADEIAQKKVRPVPVSLGSRDGKPAEPSKDSPTATPPAGKSGADAPKSVPPATPAPAPPGSNPAGSPPGKP